MKPKVHFVTITLYDTTFPCSVAFHPQTLDNILGKAVSEAGKKQLRIAETEKYPHVTYFFNGGVEVAYPGEDRVIVRTTYGDGEKAAAATPSASGRIVCAVCWWWEKSRSRWCCSPERAC